MKKLELIYNIDAGNKGFKDEIDSCINIFQKGGYIVRLFRMEKENNFWEYISNIKNENIDTIVVSGGDGTINIVLNAIIKNNINVKLGIIPAGTANDFARSLKIPKSFIKACEIIIKGKTIKSDIGKVNNKYFINVFGAGAITNISQYVDKKLKNTLGKFAYYLKGLEKIQKIKPIKLKITNSKEIIEDEIYFLIILNSSSLGGFEKIVSDAKINDGLFNFIAIKYMPIQELIKLSLQIFKDEYLYNKNVIYFKDNYIKIESKDNSNIETDIDGETGPNIPIVVKNIKRAIEIFANI